MPKRAVCDLESQLNWWAKKNYEEGRLSDSRRLNGNDVTKKCGIAKWSFLSLSIRVKVLKIFIHHIIVIAVVIK